MPSRDPVVWAQGVELHLSLLHAMAVQAHLLLALRHPGTWDGDARMMVEDAVAVLSRLLVERGGLTPAELRQGFAAEGAAGGMTWGAYEAACARIDARERAAEAECPEASC